MQDPSSDGRVGEYANSMFRFDRLNHHWIDQCAEYLRQTFGSRLHGAVVLDYAFGRGNWALAFRQAGAAQVFAVDAALDNCQRLQSWIQRQDVSGIDVVHGNVLTSPLLVEVDVVWAHGILHHMEQPVRLIEGLRSTLSGDDALMHLYAYDCDSMRQWVVELARRFVCYQSEADFRRDAPLFSHRTRLRVRDDLTAPHIHWLSVQQVVEMAASTGLAAIRRDPDFGEWQRGHAVEEFQPHNLLFGVRGASSTVSALQEPSRVHAGDLRLLSKLAGPLFDPQRVSPDLGRRRAIGLCNTHFEALAQGGITSALREDLHFLLYLLMAENEGNATSCAELQELLALAEAAMEDRPRSGWPEADSIFLIPYLKHNTLRL